MAFQNTVIEHKVSKEIIFINQDTFLPGFKAEANVPFLIGSVAVLSRMDCSKSFSVTNARSFKPKNSKVTGVLITSLGCNKVA